MDPTLKLKKFTLLIGDLLILYIALLLALAIRYGGVPPAIVIQFHFVPFTLLFCCWILVFYVGGLYDLPFLKTDAEFLKRGGIILAVNAILSIMFFYFTPLLAITPKTTLFLFLGAFGILGYGWRSFYHLLLRSGLPPRHFLLVGNNETAGELVRFFTAHPQLGYRVAFWMREGVDDKEFAHLHQIILAHHIDTIIVPAHVRKDSRAARLIYRSLTLGIEVLDLATLYERVFQKIPLAELEESWFLGNLARSHPVYETLKRPAEIGIALLLSLVLSPLVLLIAAGIWITSGRPVIFAQRRVGQGGRIFTIYKFRTMRRDAEKSGPQWASPKDARNTPIGRWLRRTHLDELPQIWNILRGELSLIGPRPERPEFVAELEQNIPFYELRHLVRPGVTGWAQINYRYGASVKDAYEKLQYDIHYLKNRSVFIDLVIVLRTIKFFFTNLY